MFEDRCRNKLISVKPFVFKTRIFSNLEFVIHGGRGSFPLRKKDEHLKIEINDHNYKIIIKYLAQKC